MASAICGVGVSVVVVSLLASGVAEASVPGHLQIAAEPGVTVDIDGQISARSQDQYGIIVRELSPGPHRLVLRRSGARTQRAIVNVVAGQVTVFTPQPWQSALPQPESASVRDRKTGMLVVQTLPVQSTLKAESLGWSEFAKGSRPFRTTTPAGRHRLTVCNEYRCIDYRVNVAAGRLRSILVDLDRGTVTDLSATHARQWYRHRQACEESGVPFACQSACEMDTDLMPHEESRSCARLLEAENIEGLALPAAAPVATVPAGTAREIVKPTTKGEKN